MLIAKLGCTRYQERCREFYTSAIQYQNSLGERERKRLKQLQMILGLSDENIQLIEAELSAQISTNPLIQHRSLTEEQGVLIPEELTEHPTEIEQASTGKDFENVFVLQEDIDLFQDNPCLEKEIDYTKLRSFLQEGRWQEADYETYLRMLETFNAEESDFEKTYRELSMTSKSEASESGLQDGIRESKLYSIHQNLQNFPCGELETIDRLWVQYSDGLFGFSVQKNIYMECGGTLDGEYPSNKVWKRFCDRVGWRRTLFLFQEYIDYDEVIFDMSAPRGHLPIWLPFFKGGFLGRNVSSLVSRLMKCNL